MKTFFEYKKDSEPDKDIDSINEDFISEFDSILNEIDDIEYELNAKEINESEKREKAYRIYKDREENFECNISVEGASIDSTQVRLVLNTDIWNIIFYGKLYVNGTCVVPIKRGLPLSVGTTGEIRLEVIVDDQLFVGWEDTFMIEASKKVKVDVKEQKSVKVIFNK